MTKKTESKKQDKMHAAAEQLKTDTSAENATAHAAVVWRLWSGE